jgi:hypothetical protein
MKITINVSKIYRNTKNLFINIDKYYAEILVFFVIIMLLCILLYKDDEKFKNIEGFSKLSDFKNRTKNREKNKDMVEGTKYDKLANSMKLLDESSNNKSDSFLGELFTDISSDNDDNTEYDLNKKIKYNKNGSKASAKNVKNSIMEYYNHFDQDKFSKKTNSTIESLRKFKHFKEEFWNIFDY